MALAYLPYFFCFLIPNILGLTKNSSTAKLLIVRSANQVIEQNRTYFT